MKKKIFFATIFLSNNQILLFKKIFNAQDSKFYSLNIASLQSLDSSFYSPNVNF